ncbi:MAG: type II secretion system protein [Candidatus Omnitrophota bacterium]
MRKKGFTLVEIMFVVLIISFLLSLVVIQGTELKKRANESNAQANLKAMAAAFEIYAAANNGAYAPGQETNLQFLIDAKCATQDFLSLNQVGYYRYVAGSISPSGYDIRALAVSEALAGHNYQITTGARIKRSDTPGPTDTNFKDY